MTTTEPTTTGTGTSLRCKLRTVQGIILALLGHVISGPMYNYIETRRLMLEMFSQQPLRSVQVRQHFAELGRMHGRRFDLTQCTIAGLVIRYVIKRFSPGAATWLFQRENFDLVLDRRWFRLAHLAQAEYRTRRSDRTN